MYTQVFKSNINEIIKIKDTFPELSPSKVFEIHNVITNLKKGKPKVNMMTKGLSRKQVIIPISTNNVKRIIVQSDVHIANINWFLKGIKSEIYTDFIHSNNKRIIITTNKVMSTLDINTIEKYIKNLNDIDLNKVMNSRLFQSKSYLKIN